MTTRPTIAMRLATTALVAGTLTISCGPVADRGQSPAADATADTQTAADAQDAS